MDEFPGSVFDPPSLHKYLYARADPVDNVDPSGRFGIVSVVAVGAIIGALAGAALYSYFTPPGQRTWKGWVIWTATGAALGAATAYGGWYAWLYYGPAITTTSGGVTLTVSRYLADRWTSVQNLFSHYRSHGQQIADVLRQQVYTAEMYAADAVWTIEHGFMVTNRYGQTAYVHFIGNSSRSMDAIFAYVVTNPAGRIITFIPMRWSELQQYVPGI
jgi:hypothetical protein